MAATTALLESPRECNMQRHKRRKPLPLSVSLRPLTWRRAESVPCPHVRPSRDQQMGGCKLPATRCAVQRSVLIVVLRMQVGAAVDQQREYRRVPLLARYVDGSGAVDVASVDIAPAVEQARDRTYVAALRCLD